MTLKFREKDVRLTFLSNSSCVFFMVTLEPIPCFLSEGLFPQQYPRTPRSNRDQDAQKQIPCLSSRHCKPFARHRLWASCSGPSSEE